MSVRIGPHRRTKIMFYRMSLDFETKDLETNQDVWVEVEAVYHPPYHSFYGEMEGSSPQVEITKISTEPMEFETFSDKKQQELRQLAALEIYKLAQTQERYDYVEDKNNAH